jgi:tetratricopeptide (TPR) repeat protein
MTRAPRTFIGSACARRTPGRLALAVAIAVAIVIGVVAADAKTLSTETPVERELAAARQALIMGDSGEAVRLFEALYSRAPGDPRVLWGLVGAYAAAGLDRERLVPLLEARLAKIPEDEQARRELGEAYARIGEFGLAHETWMGLFARLEPDTDRYSEIGALEAQYRMYEQAVATYLDGRARLASPSLFGQELAQAYTALGRFDDAVDECLLMLVDHPGLSQWAVNNVELMLERGASRARIEERMARIAEADDATPASLAFAGSALLALGRRDDALDAYVRADDLSEEKGVALIEFAGVLADEGRAEDARRAYLLVVDRAPASPYAATAGIEAARIRAASGDPAGGVAELKAVADAAAGLPEGGRAAIEAARIELRVLRAPAASLATLAESPAGPRGRRARHEAELLAIEAELALGRFEEARARAQALLGDGAEDGVREQALYFVGYISFLGLDTRGALDGFRAMVEENAAGSLVNEALRLMLVVSDAEESGDMEPLRLLAAACAKTLKWDGAGARADLSGLVSAYAGTSAAVEGLLLLAGVAENEGDIESALRTYADVVAGTTSIAARAHAMMRTGEILEGAGRTEEALAAYKGVLDDLPANHLSGEARRRIERIRSGGGREG